MIDEDESKERLLLHKLIYPIVIAMVMGVSTAFITLHLTYASSETKMEFIEKQINNLNVVVEAIHENQVQLATRSVWMKDIEFKHDLQRVESGKRDVRIDNLERRLDEAFSYRDALILQQRIDELERQLREDIP